VGKGAGDPDPDAFATVDEYELKERHVVDEEKY
jgi:hypothetical protein